MSVSNPFSHGRPGFELAVSLVLYLSISCRVDVPALDCTRDDHCSGDQRCFQGRCIARPDDGDVATDAPDLVADASEHDLDVPSDPTPDGAEDPPRVDAADAPPTDPDLTGDSTPPQDLAADGPVADTHADGPVADAAADGLVADAVADGPVADAAADLPDEEPEDVLVDAGSIDPAPGIEQTGTHSCLDGPSVEFPGYVIVRSQPADHYVFESTVTDATGFGIWYVRDHDGREQRGPIVTSLPDGEFRAVVPTWCGNSTVKLVWPGEACSLVAVFIVQTPDCRPEDLHLVLWWNPGGGDLDLHLVRPGGLLNNGDDDCNNFNCLEGGPDWGEPGEEDDPRKDADVTSGGGPENIVLIGAETGSYGVLVENWTESGVLPSDATMIVSLSGRPTAIQTAAIPSKAVWLPATVEWGTGLITVRNEVIPCAEAWTANGCSLALP